MLNEQDRFERERFISVVEQERQLEAREIYNRCYVGKYGFSLNTFALSSEFIEESKGHYNIQDFQAKTTVQTTNKANKIKAIKANYQVALEIT